MSLFTGALALAAVVGGVSATAYSAHKSSDAAQNAAQLQTDSANHAADVTTGAANHAADLQKQAADATLAFQRRQSEQAWQESDRASRANYGLASARASGAKNLGSQFGYALPDMPGYVAGVDPHYDTSDLDAAHLPSGPSPYDASPGKIAPPTPPHAPTQDMSAPQGLDYGPTAPSAGSPSPAPMANPYQPGASAPMSTMGGALGLVRLRAPNGEVSYVPSAQVAHFRALGAQVVN